MINIFLRNSFFAYVRGNNPLFIADIFANVRIVKMITRNYGTIVLPPQFRWLFEWSDLYKICTYFVKCLRQL